MALEDVCRQIEYQTKDSYQQGDGEAKVDTLPLPCGSVSIRPPFVRSHAHYTRVLRTVCDSQVFINGFRDGPVDLDSFSVSSLRSGDK